ncbi:hypothetical protein RB195_013006 [Necator americanus]
MQIIVGRCPADVVLAPTGCPLTDLELCYVGCMLKNSGSYEKDIQERCAKDISAFNSLTKCLWLTPITKEVKLRVYLSTIRLIMMYGSDTWAAPSTAKERIDYTNRSLHTTAWLLLT